jgi:glycine dehydrogenase subunit 2
MAAFSLAPAAGAHGELVGCLIMRAYHRDREGRPRKKIIVPDSAHGTNPASASMAGFEVEVVKTRQDGCVDIEALRKTVDGDVAGIMLTNPSTVGLFEKDIEEVVRIFHQNDSLLYYDGANMNAIVGVARPGDMGFDIIHLNLHKTFSTPHGGGGPGAGPVGVVEKLAPYLPPPRIVKGADGKFMVDKQPKINRACEDVFRQLRCAGQSLCLHPVYGRCWFEKGGDISRGRLKLHAGEDS